MTHAIAVVTWKEEHESSHAIVAVTRKRLEQGVTHAIAVVTRKEEQESSHAIAVVTRRESGTMGDSHYSSRDQERDRNKG